MTKATDQTTPDDWAPHVQRIATAEIDVDEHHRRQMSDKAWSDGCAELAGQIAREGLLTPIKVAVGREGRYRLVFGLRRLTAARLNGGRHIDAILGGPMSDEEIEAERMSENLNRLEASPIDEMIHLGKLYDAVDASMPAGGDEDGVDHRERAIVAAVAARIGRSAKWVRDRLYLRRLTPKVVDLVVAGRLPLAHARELAKIGSEKEQLTLAQTAARDEDGVGGMDLDLLTFTVGRRLQKLDGVVWRLDVAFGGCPACEGCEHNTGTDALLFEGGQAPEKAMCLNTTCWMKKSRAAQGSLGRAVKKAADRVGSGKLPDARIGTLREAKLIPAELKDTTVAARVRAAVKPADAGPAPVKATKPGKDDAPAARSVESLADEAWRRFDIERAVAEEQAVFERCKADPMMVFAASLFVTAGEPCSMLKKSQKAENAALHDRAGRVFAGELPVGELAAVARGVFDLRVPVASELYRLTPYFDDAIEDLGSLLLGPRPERKAWMDAWIAEHEKPAPEKPAAKKKAAKKARKKASKKSGVAS